MGNAMDDKRLKEILTSIDVPEPEGNARKVALNLALAEFATAKKESENKPQGYSLLARLTVKPGQNRRTPMKKNMKLVYGGMATAMVLVLAVGVSFPELQNTFKQGVTPEAALNQVAGASMMRLESKGQTLPKGMGAIEKDAEKPMESGRMSAKINAPAAAPLMMQSGAVTGGTAGTADMAVAAAPMIGYAEPYEPMPQPVYQVKGRDKFEHVEDNPVKAVSQEPVSTFSIDVDTSSYSFMRRQLNAGVLPQKDAVRVEEMVNYFDYRYPVPESKEQPFKPSVTVTPSPWATGHKLVHIGIKGYDIAANQKPRSNLVFLIDTSGSMMSPDKLPLVISSLKLLLDSLNKDDTVGIVTYAGSAGTALEPTKVADKAKILAALDNLSAGGSTAGAEGIRQAYLLAESHIDKNGVNRVILATDGDFNVGITDPQELKGFIERERKTGIFLSVLGFGQGNYNDKMMQDLAQNGNGTAAYIDTLNEARKILVKEAGSTLFTIAKDVKIQVEFNPATVAEYRLVGYETRALQKQDFNNDAVDAGDIGAGHAVTAIYDITPVGAPKSVDDSRYAAKPAETHKADANFSGEYAFLKIRYKLPGSDTSKLITTPITGADEKSLQGVSCGPADSCPASASDDVRFSVAVAGFAQLLKGGKSTGPLTWDDVIREAQTAKDDDEFGYRSEFIQLVRLAKSASGMSGTQPANPMPVPEQ